MKNYIHNLTSKQKKIWVAAFALFFALLLMTQQMSRPKFMTDAQIISRVGVLTQIPDATVDIPGIFRIEDPSRMPAFFKDAVRGDVALLFLKSKTAVIYSVSSDAVINKGPIVNDAPVKTETIKTKPEPVATSSKNAN